MAPLRTGGNSKQNARKRLVQPALPVISSPTRTTLAKPDPSANPAPTASIAIANDRPQVVVGQTSQEGARSHGKQELSGTEDLIDHPADGLVQAEEDPNGVTQESEAAEGLAATNAPAVHPPFSDSLGAEQSTGRADSASSQQDLHPTAEPTQENVQNLASEPYESNKVQEWAQEVNDGSTQSAYSLTKDLNVNGLASSDELPQSIPTTSNVGQEVSSRSSAHDMAAVNGHTSNAAPETVSVPQDDTSSQQLTLPTITDHLLHMATSKFWADWVIVVHSQAGPPLASWVHSLILVRSPRLETLMRQARSTYGNAVVNLYPPREILPQAMEAALRFLYSDSIVSEDYAFPKETGPNSRQARSNSLNYTMSYWVAAVELGLLPVADRARQLLEAIMDWDVAELVIKEAEDLLTSAAQIGESRVSTRDYIGIASDLRQIVMRFLAQHLNLADFKVDTASAAPLLRSRFAAIEEARIRHNPALTSMVFGSMPSSADPSPSSPQSEILPALTTSIEDQVASNILLNVDFPELKYFSTRICHGRDPDAEELVQRVVHERERRRLKILSNRTVPNKTRITNSVLWEVAGFREYFHDGILRRERAGFLLPVQAK